MITDLLLWYFYGSYIVFALLILVLRKQFVTIGESFGHEGDAIIFAGFLLWLISPISLIAVFNLKIKRDTK